MWGYVAEGEPPPKRELKPAEAIDYNPDHRPSSSAFFIEDKGNKVAAVLQVKGIGAVVLRAEYDSNGLFTFYGMSIFSKAEIGYKPDL